MKASACEDQNLREDLMDDESATITTQHKSAVVSQLPSVGNLYFSAINLVRTFPSFLTNAAEPSGSHSL